MTHSDPVVKVRIVGAPIHLVSPAQAESRVLAWARRGESRVVCLANVHMLMEAHDAPDFAAVLRASDLNCPDGRPLVWMQRALGARRAWQVRGEDLLLRLCAAAAGEGLPVGLFGSAPDVVEALGAELPTRFPGLKVVYRCAPPYRPLAPAEDDEVVRAVAASGARLLFVSLGCPKQERWMAAHRGRVPAVMLGVGAAFDMLAGALPSAPRWSQRLGLEWAHRLAREPRRLGLRYLKHNPRFVALGLRQLAGRREGVEGS